MNPIAAFLATTILASAIGGLASPLPKPAAHGTYVDRDGIAHPWYVSETHTMYWDGRPYLPVGGMFNSSYIFWEQHPNPPGRDPEAQFALTCRRLDLIRSAGIEDIYLHFCTLRVPPRIIQRVVDALEQRGFKYGIEITSVPEAPCPGFLLRPDQFRNPAEGGKAHVVLDNEKLNLSIPDTLHIRWVAMADEQIAASGTMELKPGEGKLWVGDIEVPPAATEVFYAPRVLLDPGDPAAMFTGYAAYEDKLKQWLGAIRFGPGFRFIVDPFRNEQDMSYDTLPDHDDFASGLQAHLSARYHSIQAMNAAWRTEPPLPDLSTAAGAIPVTQGCLVDAHGRLYRLAHGTQYFTDAGAYREACAEDFNCRVADAVKSVHDVPVVFKHNVAFKGMFTNSRESGGFDGIGWESYGDGASLVVHNAGVCFAQAEQSAHTVWSVVTETSPAAFETQKTEIGYVTPQRMFDAFDTFLRAGAKGLFVFGFTFDPPGGFMTTEVIRDPRNLQWMGAYKRLLDAAADRVAAYKPTYAYCYPARRGFSAQVGGETFAIDGHTGDGKVFPLPGGSWVLPAETRDVETPLLIQTRDRAEMVRAAIGSRQHALRWPSLEQFRADMLGCRFVPAGEGRIAVYSRDLKQTASWPDMPLPDRKEGGNATIEYGYYYDTFDYTTTWLDAPEGAELAPPRRALWVEGEAATEATFNLPAEDGYAALSNGQALTVFSTDAAPDSPFTASFDIPVPAPGRYDLWVRERTLSQMPPSRYRVGAGPWIDVAPDLPPADAVRLDWWSPIFAGNDLAWYKYGTIEVTGEVAQITIEALPDTSNRVEKHIDAVRLEVSP